MLKTSKKRNYNLIASQHFKRYGSEKCAYIYIERGKQVPLSRKFSINNIELNQLENGDCYKYFGQVEDIEFNGTLNKERVTKEYFQSVRKIWSSELYARNKVTSHNIFAIPVITDMSMRMRMKMTMTFSFIIHICHSHIH